MAFDREKFKNLVHYICLRCEPSKLGAVKLNKALWLADFRAFYEFGASITGDRYIKRQFGPVPSAIIPTLKELERDGLVSIQREQFHGLEKMEFRAQGQPDMHDFSQQELRIVDTAV